MDRVRLRLFPGLRRSWISERDATRAPAIVRRFHSGFPPQPTSLMATLATGQPPRVHGIFGDETLGGSRIDLPDAQGGFELTRDDRWLRTERSDEDSSAWREGLDADPATTWIVIGAPTTYFAKRFVDPKQLLPAGVRYRAESGVLRVASELSATQRDPLLRHDGVERVLFGESRQRLGLAHPEAGECVVLASAGVTFRESDVRFASDDECWIAVVGSDAAQRCRNWPNAVHDLRVAPTVALWQGRPFEHFADKPIR